MLCERIGKGLREGLSRMPIGAALEIDLDGLVDEFGDGKIVGASATKQHETSRSEMTGAAMLGALLGRTADCLGLAFFIVTGGHDDRGPKS